MKKTSFTLIELLIVISIIAMLAAMLLPALTKAKNRAGQIYCAGNLKQCFSATCGYTSDYNSYIPFGFDSLLTNYSGFATARTPTWFYQIAAYLNVAQREGSFDSLGRIYAERPARPIIFTCPSHKIPFPNNYPTSYAPGLRVANSNTIPAINGLQKGKIERVINPSAKAWLSEWTYPDGTDPAYPAITINEGNIIPGHANNFFGMRHFNSGNILFFDGHAAWTPFKDVMSPSSGQIIDRGIFDTYR